MLPFLLRYLSHIITLDLDSKTELCIEILSESPTMLRMDVHELVRLCRSHQN